MPGAASYVPRRPSETLLYRLVKAHLAEFLRHTRETYEAPLPRYVQNEFRAYLACGDFSRGFVHARCEACGLDLLVAFSCKARGLCPSCAGRRMANTAAHLVDRVLPAVAVRQYVLSFPYALSGLAATHADVLAALNRMFCEALSHHYRAWAKREGYKDAQTGTVTFVQRFGSSLNLHTHFHVIVLDGVYVADGDSVRFLSSPPPAREALAALLTRVVARAVKWLRRKGYMRDDDDHSNEDASPSPLEALAQMAMQRGTLVTLRESDREGEDEEAHSAPKERDGAITHLGFNLHASVALDAEDDLGRERLCRYGARPAFSLGRLRVLPDGRVAYRVKNVGRRRAKHRVMTPVEFLARVAALVPPPRYPLVRYAGVLAPHAKWRPLVVPQPPRASRAKPTCAPRERTEPPASTPSKSDARDAPEPSTSAGLAGLAAFASSLAKGADGVDVLATNILSVAQWRRLDDGALYAAAPRIDWATLLRRTFDVDVRRCVRCGGPVAVRALVKAPAAAATLLEILARPRGPPPA